ncbi:DNA cytosine methyltransferase [Blastochloris tepida]|uniref:DNA (cytosine-5-)-methyltransferase n=1 Tax=Blastochloris tepida TaxID=2233851 RepID=A0A348G1C7_9HYPH|nr:DNA cytosine methyltransferase [Blastochloris tepida]BBF93360.1 hypothetical protein BLTE_20450 [Blastochloris tepida]
MAELVLSLFPGIGLLDRAFEEAGFCVVRGPDLLWGGDVRRFHAPAGRFDGVIGGPPCQAHSSFAGFVRQAGHTPACDLIPEFARVVEEAAPAWFLMENVRSAPSPATPSYGQTRLLVNARHVGSPQHRVRAFVFGQRGADAPRFHVETEALEPFDWCNTVLASGGVKPGTEGRRGSRRGNEYGYHGAKALAHALEAQGLPPDFLAEAPFTNAGKFRVVGNGVPLPLGRAIAAAVRNAVAGGGP